MPIGSIEQKMDNTRVGDGDEPEDFEVRLCKDCVHCNNAGMLSQCSEILDHDYVNGNHSDSSCVESRSDGGLCGPEGRYWEAKS